ncbi:ABC transporter ATP-binding protein [Bosea sp. TWI1241]|uniref:ABC transporter ATP-binding protein n=1 Tax=Bosea sp. TWI1241 TaxID=3148904 RepID=UPI00320B036E
MAALRFEALSKTYADGTRALSGITLGVGAGEILALVGGSGCGKTTLLRLVAGLDRPSAGRILLGGAAITEPRADVGVIFQEPRLFPWLSVADNAGFGLADRPAAERRRLVEAALERVGLAGYGPRWPRELSGGQQQRVAIARALVTRPALLLMDEPFSALDATTRASLHGHLLALWEESRPTVLMVTHDVEEAVTLADRIVVMQPRPGRVFDELDNPLARPRDPLSPAFEAGKREVLRALDRSLRGEAPLQEQAAENAGMWW